MAARRRAAERGAAGGKERSSVSAAFDGVRTLDGDLADELELLEAALAGAGAPAAAKRLSLAAQRYDALQPDVLYTWMDPRRIASELDETLGQRARTLSGWRNILALLPLIVTWLALLLAANAYQAEVQAAVRTRDFNLANTPFLVLWQQGFGHAGPLTTFGWVAFIDVLLLVGVAALTYLAQRADAAAAVRTRRLAARVDDALSRLALLAVRDGGALPHGASPQDWARVVQNTIKQAMAESKEVTEKARQVIEAVGQSNEALLKSELRPMITTLRQSVNDFKGELASWQRSVATVGTTIQQIGGAAGNVATAADRLADSSEQYGRTGAAIEGHLRTLNATQQQFVGRVEQAAADMAAAAGAVQQLASQINDGMAQNLVDASRKLQQTDNQLSVTSNELRQAAALLHRAARLYRQTRFGLVGWLASRNGNGNAGPGQ